MKHNFTIRLYADNRSNCLGDIDNITISGITLISKRTKFDEPCLHKGNQKKFKYSMTLSRDFKKVAGSIQYPILYIHKGYIDIIIKGFPRFPAFYQEYSAARGMYQGYGYTNYMNKGFPIALLYRKIEIIN